MDFKSKQEKILIPEDMDAETAQQCFILGLRVFTFVYNGGAVLNYAEEKRKGISNYVFYNNEAGAVIDFANTIAEIKDSWADKKKKLEKEGSEKLQKINQDESQSVEKKDS